MKRQWRTLELIVMAREQELHAPMYVCMYVRLVLKCGLAHLNANANARDESNANANASAQHLNQMQMQMQMQMRSS